MLQIAIAQILISFVCVITGIGIHSLWRKNSATHWVVYGISGLIGLIGLAQIIALFRPIDIYSQATVLLLVILFLLFRRTVVADIWGQLAHSIKNVSRIEWFASIAFGLLILYYASGPTQMDDTESYHIQMVLWIKEWGTVPGLANLHERFGFNSSWFSGISLFTIGATPSNQFVILNSCISLWLGFYLINQTLNKDNNTVFRLAILLGLVISIISFPVLRGNAATSNYDIISCAIIIIICIESYTKQYKTIPFSPQWMIWPIFLITVRVMNFPFALLSLALLISQIKNKKLLNAGITILVVLLYILPFLIRNYYLSGYVIYPSVFPDLFSPHWKADPEIAEILTRYIKYYNRLKEFPVSETEQMSLNEWVPLWFQQLYNWDKWIVYPAFAGIIVSVVILLRKMCSLVQCLIICALLGMFLLWCLIAPDPRFIFGALIVFGIIGFYYTVSRFRNRLPEGFLKFPVVGLAILLAGFFLYKTGMEFHSIHWLSPRELPVPQLSVVKLDGQKINIPGKILNNWNARCYGSPLPCAYRVDPRLRFRGGSLGRGFYLDYSIPDSTRQRDLRVWEN